MKDIIMRCGYAGKFLKLNLSESSVAVDAVDDSYFRKYLGGNGFGAQLLFKRIKPHTDPLGEDNILIIATGPLNGTLVPMASKFCAVSKSPLTGTFMDGFSSGRFGAELKYAGFDALIIEGAADQPVYLLIDDGRVRIQQGSHLWGMDAISAQERIRRELGANDIPVLCIGPAGENLVRYACMITEHRAVGSGGFGAVMGSKKIKAIAIRGSHGIAVHDHKQLFSFARQMMEKIRNDPAGQILSTYGTSYLAMALQHLGGLPTSNWQKGRFEGSTALSAESLMDNFVTRNLACFGCMVPCGHYARVNEGPYAGATTNGPEFQGIGVFGPLVGNSRLDAVIQADRLSDELGLGQISAGVCIAFAMECYEKGLVTRADLDGLSSPMIKVRKTPE
jgi:aldehyde:ferredoxin oxidoreductase